VPRKISYMEDEIVREEWSLKIIRVDNGYFLEGADGARIVIQERDEDELLEHENLLFEVMAYFNFGGTKHDKERIRIIREPKGD
jgi:hypothetical protein